MDNSVLVLGVGPEQGLGVALCKKFAEEGYKVFGCGRSKENMEALKAITTSNGSIEGLVADVTSPEDVKEIFKVLDKSDTLLKSVIYNAGNNNAKPFLEMDLDFFQDLWDVCAKGAFLVSQEAIPRLLKSGGSLLFTGATASIRSRPPFTAFAAAKSAERSLAQGLSKEFGPKGIHVAYFIIDAAIDTPRTRPYMKPDKPDDYFSKPTAIAEEMYKTVLQDKSTWSFRVELRPFGETW